MPITYRQYGSIVDISIYEKDPFKRKKRFTKQNNVLLNYQALPCYRPRRFDSIVRAKKICLRRVSCAVAKFGSPLFITLTFNGDASDINLANESLTAFQWRLRFEYPDSVSIFVPELSPRGRIHFHGLVFNVPTAWGDQRLHRRTIKKGTERQNRILARLWHVGFVDCVQTDASPKLAFYISKYITKSGQNPLFDKIRLVRVSRGFPKELVFTGALAEFANSKYSQFNESYSRLFQTTWLGKIERRVYFTDINLTRKFDIDFN